MTSAMLFPNFIPTAELEGNVLKSGLKYQNLMNAKDLTNHAYAFW